MFAPDELHPGRFLFRIRDIGVSEAKGEKCPRCWMHSTESDENGLCRRCAAVIAQMDLEV